MASFSTLSAGGSHGKRLPAEAQGDGATLRVDLPPGAAGQWCRVRLTLPQRTTWWAHVQLVDTARGQIVRSCFLGPRRRVRGGSARGTLVHVPSNAVDLSLYIYGAADEHIFGSAEGGAVPSIEPLGRISTALRLLWFGRDKIIFSLAGARQGRLGRLRAVLGQAPARAGEAPPYATWISLYEASLAAGGNAAWPGQVAICAGDDASLAATLTSLEAQVPAWPGDKLIIRTPADWRAVDAQWVVIVQAGEILAPYALAAFAAGAARPGAAFVFADLDQQLADGTRHSPHFKPGADPLLLGTGLLTQGACAARWPAARPALAVDAVYARGELAQLHADALVHIARVLTHCGPAAAPRRALAIVRRTEAGYAPTVTALVPSAVRATHVARCLGRVAQGTDYPGFAIDVLLSREAAADPVQLARVAAVPGLRIRRLPMPDFNFAAVTNAGAAQADGELLLLLNDDVAPMEPHWLNAMVAHMQDARVGVVGARLLYGNGMVQHEGVVMGLAHLCEHAGRLRPGNEAGPMGLGLLDRQVSAVTAACLLIRADLYRRLGGMDESFAIALNDVDLCLRVRAAGFRVVYCAGATLWHYESLSLGRHYAGARAALEQMEVRRLRARWADVIMNDPFYNPLASLEPGREWQPGFPPRSPGLTGWPPNPAATI